LRKRAKRSLSSHSKTKTPHKVEGGTGEEIREKRTHAREVKIPSGFSTLRRRGEIGGRKKRDTTKTLLRNGFKTVGHYGRRGVIKRGETRVSSLSLGSLRPNKKEKIFPGDFYVKMQRTGKGARLSKRRPPQWVYLRWRGAWGLYPPQR